MIHGALAVLHGGDAWVDLRATSSWHERARPILVKPDPLQAARPLLRAVSAKLLRLPPSHPDVDDCVAETLRRAIESADRRQEHLPIGPWLTGIAKHVAIDRARARRREQGRDGSTDAGGEVLLRVADRGVDPEQAAARSQDLARVRQAMEALPDGPRRALVAFHLEGKSYQRISEELGVSLGTVATWVSRGRSEVMRRLEGPSGGGRE